MNYIITMKPYINLLFIQSYDTAQNHTNIIIKNGYIAKMIG